MTVSKIGALSSLDPELQRVIGPSYTVDELIKTAFKLHDTDTGRTSVLSQIDEAIHNIDILLQNQISVCHMDLVECASSTTRVIEQDGNLRVITELNKRLMDVHDRKPPSDSKKSAH
eukprot:GHVR01035121.1.p1 GENE.GHVR01035121.1~~GHVR01035121.1.p1  ORF type:complete len:117 (-),score=22.18 GHVR01035121.1:244-594(-)